MVNSPPFDVLNEDVKSVSPDPCRAICNHAGRDRARVPDAPLRRLCRLVGSRVPLEFFCAAFADDHVHEPSPGCFARRLRDIVGGTCETAMLKLSPVRRRPATSVFTHASRERRLRRVRKIIFPPSRPCARERNERIAGYLGESIRRCFRAMTPRGRSIGRTKTKNRPTHPVGGAQIF